MYKIYYSYNNTETLFCDDASTLDPYKLTDAVLQLASNSAGSLDFEMSPINIAYNMLNRMRGTVKVTKNDKITWEGRILQEDSDFWGNKSIYCEGILACLNDTRQPQMIYKDMPLRSYMESLLSIHNQKVDDTRRFEIGIVTVNDGAFISPRKTNYESTWECFASLVDEYGGYLIIRYDGDKRYLDYRKECPRTSSQKIEFGVNLMDFTKSYDMSSLCTVLLPLGQTLASAGSKTIGDVINANVSGGWYIDAEDGYDLKYEGSLDGHYFGSSSYIAVEAGKTYYISCRNHGGRVMWALKDAGWNLIDTYSASTSEGMTDLVEYRLEIPKSDVGNVYYLAIAGFGYDIQPRVNTAIEADEAFDEYTTVESVNNGSLYVTNQEAVTAYGWIEKQLTWANITDPAELKRVAETYLREGQFDEMSLEIKAVDLQTMGIDADRIDILDEVLVVSEPHGLNKTFPVTELNVHIGRSQENKFTLGYKTEQTLSGVVSSTNDEIFAKLNQIPSRSAILESARNNATMLINNTLSGIFMLEQNEDGTNIGFRISNVEDWGADGAKGWRFTMGGLGFFGDGFDKPVTLALTGEDGGIVANCITSGTMYGDRIHGGTLTLGGYNNDNGILLVRNAAGDDICRFDNNGGYINGELYDVDSNGYWLRMAEGKLSGGTPNNEQAFVLDATTIIVDTDTGKTYVGLNARAPAFDFRCDMFAVNGKIGNSGAITYINDISFTFSNIDVITDARMDSNGELQISKTNIQYMSGYRWGSRTIYFKDGIMCTITGEDYVDTGNPIDSSSHISEEEGTGGKPSEPQIGEYTQISFIRTTGRQYISTGYLHKPNTRIECEILLTKEYNWTDQYIFGHSGFAVQYNDHYGAYFGHYSISFSRGGADYQDYENNFPFYQKIRIVFDNQKLSWYDSDSGSLLGEADIPSSYDSAQDTGEIPLYIGAINTNESAYYHGCFALYSFKIYEGDTLKMDFIPAVRNADNIAGLLENISGNFFASDSDVDFVSPNFNSSYERVAALDTHGAEWLDTGIIHTVNTRLELDAIPMRVSTSRGGMIFGANLDNRDGEDSWVAWANSTDGFGFSRGHSSYDWKVVSPSELDLTARYLITAQGGTVSFGSASYTDERAVTTDGILSMFLFNHNTGNSNQFWHSVGSVTRFYGCKIYDNGTLVRDFIPAKRKSDDMPVFWDNVSQMEFTNLSYKGQSTVSIVEE